MVKQSLSEISVLISGKIFLILCDLSFSRYKRGGFPPPFEDEPLDRPALKCQIGYFIELTGFMSRGHILRTVIWNSGLLYNVSLCR